MALRRVPREGGGPVARFALVLVQEDWIPAFAGNADNELSASRYALSIGPARAVRDAVARPSR